LFYDAKTKNVQGINGSGRSPANLTLEKALARLPNNVDSIPSNDLNSVTVPGAAAGWWDTVEWFGSGKLTMEQILAPAIELAEQGFPVSPITAYWWARSEDTIKKASDNYNEILIDGKAPREGQIMTNKTLAQTFRTVAKEGRDGFYKGRIAQAIVDLIQSKGGHMELSDLESHKTERIQPISIDYEGVTVWECPPNGQGLTALMALGILTELQASGKIKPLAEVEHNGTEYIHAVVESLRIAFADTRWYIADPATNAVPVKDLLSPSYLKSRAEIFDPKRAAVDVTKGSPVNSSDTVYFSVVDDEGNACSFIISNYMGFGSAAVPKGCGFTLQNRGSNFTLAAGHPNCLAPSKRPYHTIIPSMITRARKGTEGTHPSNDAASTAEHDLVAVFGVMGGFMQPQGHVQVVLNLLHAAKNPQECLDTPRICLSPAMPRSDSEAAAYSFSEDESVVYMEEGFKDSVLNDLKAMGHRVEVLTGHQRGMFGRGQLIWTTVDERTHKRILIGGSDPRGDGQACGW
ncbi:hypothetical protein BZG36_05461, partial [Bifiguratus adelaidae]